MPIDPRLALNICLASTGTVWILLILSALGGEATPLGYALLTLCIGNTTYLYWRFKGTIW